MAFPWKTVFAASAGSAIAASFLTYSVLKRNQKVSRDSKSSEKSEKLISSEVIFFPDPKTTPKGTKEENGLRHSKILNSSEPLKRLLGHIRSAKKSLDICLFLITSHHLADEVIGRIKKGVTVRIILDDSSVSLTGSAAGRFLSSGAYLRSRPLPYLMHHKFAIVDGKKLVNGSFNWTMQAVMGNKENVIVTDDAVVVKEFVREFEALWEEVGVTT